jgi:hypothetical protein
MRPATMHKVRQDASLDALDYGLLLAAGTCRGQNSLRTNLGGDTWQFARQVMADVEPFNWAI